jgi:PmbA protein
VPDHDRRPVVTAVLDASAGVDVAVGAVEKAQAAGADEAQVTHVFRELFEITYDNHDVTMVRTTVTDEVSITVFVDQAKGQSSLTGRSPDLIDRAVGEAVAAARSGMADPANGVAEGPSTGLTEFGHRDPDKDQMLDAVVRHQAFMAESYPTVLMRDSTYSFSNRWKSFANSAGRQHQERRGGYAGNMVFSARDGEKATSFNGTGASAPEPFGELIEMGTLRQLLDATVASFDAMPVPETFVGDVIFTPDSLDTLVGPVLQSITGYSLMRGTSPFQDSVGEAIADAALTIANRPCSPAFPLASSFDGDGVPAADLPVVTKGVLEHHLIDWFTSRKLGKPMTAGVFNVDVAPGDATFDEIVASTERGIVLGRFSGGMPNQKLDFSGVAKNSFYVEDGRIVHPVHETMIAGNFADLLKSIRAVGSQSVNYGGHAYPALAAGGVTISSK